MLALISFIVVIIGAINWFCIGLLQFDFVDSLTCPLSLSSPSFALSSKLLVVFSWLTHLISLYENSAHQEISPNVNNKYL